MAILAVRLVGVFLVISGILYLIKPSVIRKMLTVLSKGNRLYLIGVIRLALAVLFLLAANQADIPWVIAALAIILIISSTIIFAFGPRKLQRYMIIYQEQNDTTLRLLSLVIIILGAVIVYAA